MQRQILGRYHVTNPDNWYQNTSLWEIPKDPIAGATSNTLEPPFYLSIKWPSTGESSTFSLTTAFVPKNRSNLAAYMAVNADASSPQYGRLRILRMSDSSQIDGPGQSFNAMTTNEKVADRLRPFLNQGASSAAFGNLLTLPVGGGLLYVTPVYTQRQGSTGSYPALRFVVVRFGQEVGIGDTLQQALDQVFGESGAKTGEGGEGDGAAPKPTGQADNTAASQALDQADKAFTEANKALKTGDLATYQTKINEAEAAVQRALTALGR